MHDPNQLNFNRAREEKEISGITELDDIGLEAKASMYYAWQKNSAELTSREQEALSRLIGRVVFEADYRGLEFSWLESQPQLESAER